MTDGKRTSMRLIVFDSKNCSSPMQRDILVPDGQDSVCINLTSMDVSLQGRGRGICRDNALIASYYSEAGCTGERVVYGELRKEVCRDMSVGLHGAAYKSVEFECQLHKQGTCNLPDGTLGTGRQCDDNGAQPKETDDDGYRGVYKAGDGADKTSGESGSANSTGDTKPSNTSKPDEVCNHFI